MHFVNADLLARELNPDDPSAVAYEAAALADQERRQLVEMGESFCMETVFSDPVGDKLYFLKEARMAGYHVLLIFIGIESPGLSEARVIQRVSEGGHDVPDDRLRSRFPRTLENLRCAIRSSTRFCYWTIVLSMIHTLLWPSIKMGEWSRQVVALVLVLGLRDFQSSPRRELSEWKSEAWKY